MELPNIQEIKRSRKRIDMTQTELARASGVSQSLIAKIETGRIDPAYSKVKAIFEALERKLMEGTREKSLTAKELMTKEIIQISPQENLERGLRLMSQHEISQLPVLQDGICIGSVTDDRITELIAQGKKPALIKVAEVMEGEFPRLPENATVETIASMLEKYKAVLVEKNGKTIGIVSKFDLLKTLKSR